MYDGGEIIIQFHSNMVIYCVCGIGLDDGLLDSWARVRVVMYQSTKTDIATTYVTVKFISWIINPMPYTKRMELMLYHRLVG